MAVQSSAISSGSSSKRFASVLSLSYSPPSSPNHLALIPFGSSVIDGVHNSAQSSKHLKKNLGVEANSDIEGEKSDPHLDVKLFDDEDIKDYEWIEFLADKKSYDNRSQLLELMERLNVYDEEQLRLSLRKLRQFPNQSIEVEAAFPRPVRRSLPCPSPPSRSAIVKDVVAGCNVDH